ncbi:hypothetical protein AAE478_000018 [Parahypoxylon ruwenzoriense]
MPAELPVLTVADAAAWSSWLSCNGSISTGVWLTLAKKSAGTASPTLLRYAQALDEALCHGWIDGQARAGDKDGTCYSQRFTARTARSAWSHRNVENIARLEREGRMTESGRRAVKAAKADGRWDVAYAGQATAEMPPEFIAAVAAVPTAKAAYETLTKQNRFAIYYRINSLKTQAGRKKRIAAFVEMLAQGETPYPQKQRAGTSTPPVSITAVARKEREERAHRPHLVGTRRSARLSQRAKQSSRGDVSYVGMRSTGPSTITQIRQNTAVFTWL